MQESKIISTPWTEEEEEAFTNALGKWVRKWFSDCARSGNSVKLGPTTEQNLAIIWRTGREYEAKQIGNG